MPGFPVFQKGPEYTEAIKDNHKNVTTAGTAVPLVTAPTACLMVVVQAKRTNGGLIYVGGPSVPNNDTGGILLQAEDAVTLFPWDLARVYINSTVNGEGVTFSYW